MVVDSGCMGVFQCVSPHLAFLLAYDEAEYDAWIEEVMEVWVVPESPPPLDVWLPKAPVLGPSKTEGSRVTKLLSTVVAP